MYIRIPTGIKTLSLTAQRKGLVEYKCTKCGKVHLQEICLKATQVTSYHIFGGEKARIEAENKARTMVVEALDARGNELFNAINVQRDYIKIHEPIICQSCGEKQIWSTIPKPWKRSRGFGFWIVGVIACALITLSMCLSAGALGLAYLPLLFVLLALPLIRKRKQKKVLTITQETSFRPPKYYNHSNMHELMSRDIFPEQA